MSYLATFRGARLTDQRGLMPSRWAVVRDTYAFIAIERASKIGNRVVRGEMMILDTQGLVGGFGYVL